MEEVNNSKHLSFCLNCESKTCDQSNSLYCRDHCQVLCNSCSTDLHKNCKCDEIPSKKDVADSLNIAKFLLSMFEQNLKQINESTDYKDFNEEFKIFSEMLEKINGKFTSSIDDNKPYEFCSIMEEVSKLQAELFESDLFTELSKSKELKHIFAESASPVYLYQHEDACPQSSTLINEVNLQLGYNTEIKKSDNIYIENKETEQDQINQCRWSKEELKTNEMSNLSTSNHSNITQEYENNIQEAQLIEESVKNNSDHSYKNTKISEQVHMRLEEQKYATIDPAAEKVNQRERNILMQEHELHSLVFSRIYQRNTGKEVDDIPNFYLRIYLEDVKQKQLLKEFRKSKLRLPYLNGIRLERISDNDANLNRFLRNCAPVRLRLLAINCWANRFIGVKSEFYIGSLLKAVASATKEIYFHCIDFRMEDLQSIIKAACKTERIVFNWCCIHCSSELDFDNGQNYKTQFLSFQQCGRVDYQERTTDWKADPPCFQNIVNAISRCGLRFSLKRVSIAYNPTLDKSQVQALFNEKGMSNILVDETSPVPLSS